MDYEQTFGLKFGDKRDSIRVETIDRFGIGSVWIADMLHVPYGVRTSLFGVR
jgi:hypothetical protein